MAGKTASTALQTAMQGGKVSDKAAQGALGSAVSRIANLTKKANTSKEAMMETGTLVLHTAETQGSLFLSSMAEGYLGEEKLKLGSVDLRAPVGLLAQGYGLYQTMTGQKGAGAHVLALGNGVMGSWLANVARNAGRTLAEKRAANQAPAQPQVQLTPAAQPMVVMQGALPGPTMLLPEPGVAGPVREVLLTPEPVAAGGEDDFGRRHRRGDRRPGPGRFVRAARNRDRDDDESDAD
ncbi:MAG TPA: hypothetical protein PKA64_25255 [Myxococcota bacterium]|nr:hypothetical protein [Myxococcota bacterium]